MTNPFDELKRVVDQIAQRHDEEAHWRAEILCSIKTTRRPAYDRPKSHEEAYQRLVRPRLVQLKEALYPKLQVLDQSCVQRGIGRSGDYDGADDEFSVRVEFIADENAELLGFRFIRNQSETLAGPSDKSILQALINLHV